MRMGRNANVFVAGSLGLLLIGCKASTTSQNDGQAPTPPSVPESATAQPKALSGQELGERSPVTLVEGSEQPVIRPPDGPCPFNLAYLFAKVIVFDGIAGGGLRVVSRPADVANLCSVSALSPLLEVTEEDVFLMGVVGDILLIDQGTGPDFRSLRVFDLSQKKESCTQSYYGPKPVRLEAGGVSASIFTKVSDKKPACEEAAKWEASGLGVAYLERQLLDLKACSLKPTGDMSCGPLQ